MGKLLGAFVSFVALFVAILVARYFNREDIKADKIQRPFDPINTLLRNQRHHVDEMCSETTKFCFTITDRLENTSGRTLAFRGLRLKGSDGVLLLSEARLLIPKKLTYRNIDTAKWKIDKTTVRLLYARTMLAGVFFSEAVELNSPTEYKILILGLGGGVMNNYLSTMPNQKVNS
ncbi:unnamed protein product [Strongylus vulgaris]|uniref:Uncharacterized protein n=1 Tax=Strongylus vulgaris TaxID=40348 RepID=A0A3P7KH38_STRVU|nr:unnamed protein product [Strongylus vulgaris]